jgi:hypothetical protein
MQGKGRRKMTIHPLFRSLALASVASALFAAASLAQTPPAAPAANTPIPRGEARIWFYRDLAPYENLAETFVRLNGTAVGVSQAGGAFFVDVVPGHYNISADSYLPAPEQTSNVDLVAGQEIYAKVLPLDPWIDGGGGGGNRGGGGGYRRNTFYVWLYPPEAARPAIAQSPYYGSGTLTAARPPG